jgi:hypothetical protein
LERSAGIYSRARSGFNLGDSAPMDILGVSFETVTHDRFKERSDWKKSYFLSKFA